MQHFPDLFDHGTPFLIERALRKSCRVQSFTSIERARQELREKVIA